MLNVAIVIVIVTVTGGVALKAWVGALRGFQVDAFIAASLLLIFVLTAAGLAWPQRRPSGLSGGHLGLRLPTGCEGAVGGIYCFLGVENLPSWLGGRVLQT